MWKINGCPLNRFYHISIVAIMANMRKIVNKKIKLIFLLTYVSKPCILIKNDSLMSLDIEGESDPRTSTSDMLIAQEVTR